MIYRIDRPIVQKSHFNLIHNDTFTLNLKKVFKKIFKLI